MNMPKKLSFVCSHYQKRLGWLPYCQACYNQEKLRLASMQASIVANIEYTEDRIRALNNQLSKLRLDAMTIAKKLNEYK